MHADCQLPVTRQFTPTLLIVRELGQRGNGKLWIAKNIIFDLTRYGTRTYVRITSGQVPSVTRYPVTGKVLAHVKVFSYGKALAVICRWSRVDVPQHQFGYMTSLRLRRNAGTSRSSCSKFATMPLRMSSGMFTCTLSRMLSREITSPPRWSEACANGTGALSSS